MPQNQREEFLRSVAASASTSARGAPSPGATAPVDSRRGRGARRGVARGANRRRQTSVNSRSSASRTEESIRPVRAASTEMQDPSEELSSLTTQEVPASGASSVHSPTLQTAESPCSICCEPIEIIAIGPCNHNLMCGPCCLRMRLHYKDTSCPFCKANMTKVFMTKDTDQQQKFEDLMGQNPRKLWNKDTWAKGIYVQKGQLHESLPLQTFLERLTSWGCNLCNKLGENGFMSHRQLRHHLRSMHGRDLCDICTKAGRCFPLELETFPDPHQRRLLPENRVGPSLKDHMKMHPRCEFCNTHFYDKDEMYQHMRRVHCTCHVCERGGLFYQYFRHGQELLSHMRSCHYVCNEGHCANAFVGFATEEELSAHISQEHLGRMPRWNPQRSRPLAMEYLNYNVTAALRDRDEIGTNPGASSSRRHNCSRGQGRVRTSTNSSRLIDDRADHSGIVDTSANFQLIDDNEFPEDRGRDSNNNLAPVTQSNSRRLESLEDFPVLATNGTSGPEVESSAKKLITVHCRCPCGRRKQFPVIEEGKPIPKLECNRECACTSRRAQLADAFGIDDPNSYVPVADRAKDVEFPLDLVTWAYNDLDGARKAESQIRALIMDNSTHKVKVPVTNKVHRAAVESLMEIYGLATRNPGQYSVPFVEGLRTSCSALPRPSLVEHVTSLSEDDILESRKAMEALRIHFVDINPCADLQSYLRDFSGDYKWEQKGSTATATFKTAAAHELASAVLAGGRKGQFRILRENKNNHKTTDDSSNPLEYPKPDGSWVPVTGQGKGWASVVRNDTESPSDAWDGSASGMAGGKKELSYLVLKRKNRVGGKEGNDQEKPIPLELRNEWEVLGGE